mgnify:CR=1 FL=1
MTFSIVMADPNWPYYVWSEKGKGRSAENHYRTSPLDEIKQVPIPDLFGKNGHLCLWATYPNLPMAFEVAQHWGFKYTTVLFTLVKLNKRYLENETAKAKRILAAERKRRGEKKMMVSEAMVSAIVEASVLSAMQSSFFIGNGHYTRANPELCILFTKGKPISRQSKAVRNLIVTPFEKHSKKPDEANARIDQLWGLETPKAELYARRIYPGWTCLGDEIDGLKLEVSIPQTIKSRAA